MRKDRGLEVCFATQALQKRLGTDKARVRAYGSDIARTLARRQAQMQAASTLADLACLGKCHELKGGRKGELAVSVTANLRLVFEPADDPVPTKDDGGLDWTRVTSIRILEVIDYHGD